MRRLPDTLRLVSHRIGACNAASVRIIGWLYVRAHACAEVTNEWSNLRGVTSQV